MTTAPAEKAILASFQSPDDIKKSDTAAKLIRSPDTRDAFQTALASLKKPQTDATLAGLIPQFSKSHLPKVAEFLFSKVLTANDDLDTQRIAEIAPTLKSLLLWIGKGPESKAKTEQLTQIATLQAAEIRYGPLISWYVEHASPQQDAPVLEILQKILSNTPHHQCSDLLLRAFATDRCANRLSELLNWIVNQDPAQKTFISAFAESDELFLRLTDLLPLALSRLDTATVSIIESILAQRFAKRETTALRLTSSGCLHLASAIMRHPICPAANSLLSMMDRLSRAMTTQNHTPQFRENFCGIHLAAEHSDSAHQTLSTHGAALVAQTLSQITAAGQDPTAIEDLAFNLGLREICAKNEIVVFQPLLHEDTIGGLLPGDQAAALTSGWKLSETIVERAKVAPCHA